VRLALHIFEFITLGTELPACLHVLLVMPPFSLGWLWPSLVEIIRQPQNTKEKGKNPHILLGNTVLHKALTRSSL